VRAVGYEAGQLRLEVALADQVAADTLIGRLAGAGLDSQLQEVSGEAPQSLARIVIKGSAQ
jgi:hypothetical protein